jgi:peptidyl-tRNA hydrolase
VQNIIDLIGTKKFTRLRIGIGKIENEQDRNTADYVLDRMENEELITITNLIENDLLGKLERLPVFVAGSDLK